MSYLFIHYPKCSTCQKAKKFLTAHNISFIDRHIVEDTPTFEELKVWIKQSNLPIKKFFNTNGNVYKDLNLKDKLDSMSEDEMLHLLAGNGMLIKRPLLIGESIVLAGFKESDYRTL